MTLTFPAMPYFDIIMDQLDRENPRIIQAFGRNVHWGYWVHPKEAETTPRAFGEATEEMSRQILAMAAIRDNTQIVDVGCGFGGTMALLNESHSSVSLIGLNIDERQLRRAERASVPRPGSGNSVRFIEGDACAIPLPDASADTVLAVECAFHFASRRQFIADAFRVLRPGGRLVLSDFTAFAPTLPLLDRLFIRKRQEIASVFGPVKRPRTLQDFQGISAEIGFSDFQSRDVTAHTLPTYAVLQRLATEFGGIEKDFSRAHRFIGRVSRFGLYRYCIMAFTKPRT